MKRRRKIFLLFATILVIAGYIFWPDPTQIKMVRIPPVTYVMGSPESEPDRYDNETLHAVKITKAFYMSATPVTQAQWRAVMGTNPGSFKGDDLPVDSVTWDDAISFCQKLSTRDHKKYRLPTEAEWEYACRAGTTTEYSTGNGIAALNKAGWYTLNSTYFPTQSWLFSSKSTITGRGTHPVAEKAANAWGLYDMHGNVWQWCSDWHSDYTGDAENPAGPPHGKYRALRGGSWANHALNSRSAYRYYLGQDVRLNIVGFRVVLETE